MPNNGAVVSPIYQPAMRVIDDITNDIVPTVTTTFDHNFFDTDIVKFIIPVGFGMQEINGKTATIVVTGDTTFTIDIDTSAFDVFSDPGNNQFAQVIPIAEQNSTLYGATKNTLPSFNR